MHFRCLDLPVVIPGPEASVSTNLASPLTSIVSNLAQTGSGDDMVKAAFCAVAIAEVERRMVTAVWKFMVSTCLQCLLDLYEYKL